VKDGVAQADHIPFVRLAGVATGERLVAHVSKLNDTWRSIGAGCEALLVFAGGSAYISPSLYPSKKTTHEVVPTWNYASVHLRGHITCSHDSAEKRHIVEQLTRKMESGRSEPWAVSDAPAAYIDRMLAGIVALRFDIEAMKKAYQGNQRGRKIRGGSTISQQLAKNLFLWSGRSYVRKGLEAWYTLLIETFWSKRRILEVYVNVVEFGDGVYGAEAAARRYYGVSAAKLGPAQSARLAAVLPNPKKYSVAKPGPYVQRRSRGIQRQMQRLGGPSYLDGCCR